MSVYRKGLIYNCIDSASSPLNPSFVWAINLPNTCKHRDRQKIHRRKYRRQEILS